MTITPDLDDFRAAATQARVISVFSRVHADDLTAVGLYQHLCGDRSGTFLLESAERGVWSRYSFIGVNSVATLTEADGHAVWRGRPIAGLPTDGDPIEALQAAMKALHTPASPTEDQPTFMSGMVGYLGYDLVRRRVALPDTNPDDLGLPELVMMVVSDLVVLDHHTGELWLIANAINLDDTPERVDEAYADAVARVEAMAARLAEPVATVVAERVEASELQIERQRTQDDFTSAVAATIERVRAGDVEQVVVSQRFSMASASEALDVYRVLRRLNPSPYLYLLRLDGWSLVGSSPESMVKVSDGLVVTRPIAGTRRRGRTPEEDAAMEAELLADPKEQAEHQQLADLGESDLNDVCEPGSVQVTEMMKVLRYSHVMHLEATVIGRPRADVTALDVTLACFPAGTLTGTPRTRSMEIIDELEVTRRGPYGGAVGYLDFAGNGDMAIAIRTAVLKDGRAYVQAGAGVVADSIPHREDLETRNKAAAVLQAVAEAGQRKRWEA